MSYTLHRSLLCSARQFLDDTKLPSALKKEKSFNTELVSYTLNKKIIVSFVLFLCVCVFCYKYIYHDAIVFGNNK